MTAQVGIIMGSKSDLPVMKEAAEFLYELEIPFEITVVSRWFKSDFTESRKDGTTGFNKEIAAYVLAQRNTFIEST